MISRSPIYIYIWKCNTHENLIKVSLTSLILEPTAFLRKAICFGYICVLCVNDNLVTEELSMILKPLWDHFDPIKMGKKEHLTNSYKKEAESLVRQKFSRVNTSWDWTCQKQEKQSFTRAEFRILYIKRQKL